MAWRQLIQSIREHRSYDARFYKPVCLMAVIDALESGEVTPQHIRPEVVLRRFREIVEPVFPERADMGWEPLWHLSNDGAWQFYKNQKPVGPAAFRTGKPKTKKALLEQVDYAAVPTGALKAWEQIKERTVLRQAVLQILEEDNDYSSKEMWEQLKSSGASHSDQQTAGGTVPQRQGFSRESEENRAQDELGSRSSKSIPGEWQPRPLRHTHGDTYHIRCMPACGKTHTLICYAQWARSRVDTQSLLRCVHSGSKSLASSPMLGCNLLRALAASSFFPRVTLGFTSTFVVSSPP